MTSTDHAPVAVITGASSGIGAAAARALAADGYRVALLARRVDRITALAAELGNGALAIEADVTDRDALLAAADRVQQELGGADVLVNNAGPRPRTATSARSATPSGNPASSGPTCSWRPRSGSATTATTRPCTDSTRAPASSASTRSTC